MTQSASVDASRLQRAFDLVNEAVQRKQLPSAVLAVANRHELLRCEAFSYPGGDQVSADTIYLLASISKPITATAVMQMVEAGRLLLSDPVTRYIPEFSQPGKLPVNVWNLLTHTSGMEEQAYFSLLLAAPGCMTPLQAACQSALHFVPGTRYEYCTISFYILAEIVARLSGMPFARYLQENVLAPLGMESTSFNPGDNPRAVWAEGMDPDPQRARELVRRFVAAEMPGGGLWSTAADLVAFGQAYLNGGRHGNSRILAPSTIEWMTREHTTGLFSLVEGRQRPAHYGLGWGKSSLNGTQPGSPRAFEHGGATGTGLWIDPEWDLVFVFLTNRFGIEDHVRQGALQAVYSALDRR